MTRLPTDALGQVLAGSQVRAFAPPDLAELVVLQRCCWVAEAIANETLDIPALHETAGEVLAWATTWDTVVLRLGPRLVGAVRGRAEGRDWQVGRLMVAPDLAGRGIGSALLALIEGVAPDSTERFVLFTGARSGRNIRTYERAGYILDPAAGSASGHIAGAVVLTKSSPPRPGPNGQPPPPGVAGSGL